MNQLVPTDKTSTREIGIHAGAGGANIAPQNLGEVVRFAEVMCKADIALPPHLRGNAGACMAVALQAMEWGMSPFAVASKSYAVKGAIAYEAQLIAAVVNTRSGIKGRLRYEFIGSGDDLSCKVTGSLDGEDCTYETPPIGAITTKNSPLWKVDPRQQLGYFAARSWARRHVPEVLLGVYDRDEAETFQGPDNAKDITPATPSVMSRLQARATDAPAERREGFDPDFVARETVEPASETAIEQETSSAVGVADDAGTPAEDPSPSPAAEQSAAVDPAGDLEVPPASEPSADTKLSDEDRQFLVRVFTTMKAAVGPDIALFTNQAKIFKDEVAGKSALVKAKATKIRTELERCCGDDPQVGTNAVGKYLASIIGVEEKELVG